jgi:hypothetical protein
MSQSACEHIRGALEEMVNIVDEFENTTRGETDTIFVGSKYEKIKGAIFQSDALFTEIEN